MKQNSKDTENTCDDHKTHTYRVNDRKKLDGSPKLEAEPDFVLTDIVVVDGELHCRRTVKRQHIRRRRKKGK